MEPSVPVGLAIDNGVFNAAGAAFEGVECLVYAAIFGVFGRPAIFSRLGCYEGKEDIYEDG